VYQIDLQLTIENIRKL